MSNARYLYCVIPASAATRPVGAPALDGGPVQVIRHRDIALLTHACAPEPYQGPEPEVCAWAAAHNAVIEAAWKTAGTVLPMSFNVIVRGDSGRSAEENVSGWIETHHDVLCDRLSALRGRVELGVQILRADDRAGSDDGEPQAGRARPRGHAYFARHQSRREQRERQQRVMEEHFRRHCEMLAAMVDDARVNRPRPVREKIMILNLSLLADPAGVRRVGDYLEGVSQEPGTEVRFTGPWPPYSFTGAFGELMDASVRQ